MSEVIVTEPITPAEPITPDPAEQPKPAEELGESGLKALHSEREARKAAELKLKEFEDRDKTEAEKAAERLAAAEKRATELEAKATRAEVAATKSVPTTLLAGPASGSAEDLAKFADALIAFRGDQGSNRLHVPNEGKSPTTQPNSESEFVSNLFGGGSD